MGVLAERGRAPLLAAVLVAGGLAVLPATVRASERSGPTVAHELSSPIAHRKTFVLRRRATDLAFHWRGPRSAVVRWSFRRKGRRFGAPRRVPLDEVGATRRPGETFGSLVSGRGVKAVRVWATRRLSRASLLTLRDRGAPVRFPVSSA